MGLRKLLILRKPRSGCLEERTALIQPIPDSFTRSIDGMLIAPATPHRRDGRSRVAPDRLGTR